MGCSPWGHKELGMTEPGYRGRKERMGCIERITRKLTLPYERIESQWEFAL